MVNIKQVFRISKREFKAMFFSPIAYVVMVIFLIFIGAFYIFTYFVANRVDHMSGFFNLLPIVFAVIMPAVSMRLFSEEFNTGSYELLVTLPVSSWDIVLGKFLSGVYFVVFLLLPTVFYPLMLSVAGAFDPGVVLGGYIGSIILGSSLFSIGLFTSSLTKDQVVAFIISLVFCILLWFIDKPVFFMPPFLAGFFQYLSTDFHFQNISKGILDIRDLVYFLSLMFVFLFATRIAIHDRTIK